MTSLTNHTNTTRKGALTMKIPSREYCDALVEKYAVPAPIRRHCAVVERVGEQIARDLVDAGVPVDVELVVVGCRLHDAFKAASLRELIARPEWGYQPSERELQVWAELREQFTGVHETIVAAQILAGEFPEFSEFVAKIGSTGNPTYLTERLELKILHYADWRVQFEEIIDFDDRLEYLRDTYRHEWIDKGATWWEDALAAEKELEAEIFEDLDYSPGELTDRLRRTSPAGYSLATGPGSPTPDHD